MKNEQIHRILLCCAVLMFCPASLCAQAAADAAILVHTGKQVSREVRNNVLHLFGGQKTELTMQFSGLCGPVHGRRVTLLQVAGKLAVPLGTVHEDAGAAAEQPLHVQLSVPEVAQPADFQLAVAFQRSKDGKWALLDTVKIKAYPAKFFSAAAGGYSKLFDFAVLDSAGHIQQLFSAAGIPFADLSEGQSLPQASDSSKSVLALCALPVQADAKIEQDVAAIKKLTDYAVIFKPRTNDLATIHIREKELLYQVQADSSLIEDLAGNPKSQDNLLSLINLVFNHLHEQKGAK